MNVNIYNIFGFVFQVIDFGSSCYEHQRVYTYIQSRFYRAPEVILGAKYGTAIDMWSLGCILAELLTGYALFPGEDENDQLACIIELLGMPPQKLLDQSKRAKNFISVKGFPRYCSAETLEDGRIILSSGTSRQGKERGPPGSKNLRKALKGCEDPLFLNFLCGCLEWDPEVRMTPTVALKHSWFRRRLPRPPLYIPNASVPNTTTQPNVGPSGAASVTGSTSNVAAHLNITNSLIEHISNFAVDPTATNKQTDGSKLQQSNSQAAINSINHDSQLSSLVVCNIKKCEDSCTNENGNVTATSANPNLPLVNKLKVGAKVLTTATCSSKLCNQGAMATSMSGVPALTKASLHESDMSQGHHSNNWEMHNQDDITQDTSRGNDTINTLRSSGPNQLPTKMTHIQQINS